MVFNSGGVGVLPGSQTIAEQCKKIEQIKRYKAGFQDNLITFSGNDRIKNLVQVIRKTGYKIFPVTDTGVFHGKLIGIITDKDFDPRYDQDLSIRDRMRTDIQYGIEITDLKEANKIMIQYGRGFLPIISREGTLQSVVFKQDLDKHIQHPEAFVDDRKRLCIGAAISTHPEDRERALELVKQQVDFLVIDASHGHSVYQKKTIADGGITTTADIVIALTLGADTVMMGNFFARFTEGNSKSIRNRCGKIYKEYWMEGTKRAHNNRRYSINRELFFEEGISGYVTHIGSLYDHLPAYINRIKAALSTAGVNTIEELHQKGVLETISPGTKMDSQVHSIVSQRWLRLNR